MAMNAPQIEAIRPEHIKDVLQLIKELAVYEREPDAVVIDEQLLQDVLFHEAYGWVAEEKEVIDWRSATSVFPLGRAPAAIGGPHCPGGVPRKRHWQAPVGSGGSSCERTGLAERAVAGARLESARH